MSDSNPGIDDLQKLLDSYPGYALGGSTPPTLMEIAGFPHWENVYSNILAFFLDTGEPHGFGPLFVQSILAAYRGKCPDKWPGKDPVPENVSETDKVEREASTEKGRIDLLVECSEFVVCIENKIWSGLQNDLGEYRQHCEKMSEKRQVLGIVLSPVELGAADKQKMDESKFVNVTYPDFAKELQHRLGGYIGWRNTQYQYLLFDFIEQASRFGGKKIMNEGQREFLKFWRENDKKIANMQSMCDEWRKKLRGREKAQAHIDQCLEKLENLNPAYVEVFKSWIAAGHVAVFDLADGGHIDQCHVFLNVEFYPHKVSQVLGKRRGVEPAALASRISETCDVAFEPHEWADGKASGRQALHDDNSPFEQEVLAKAVGNSVKILKALAELKLGAGGDAALK